MRKFIIPLITLLLLSSCTYLPQVDKVRSFKDMRKFRRRALCTDDTSPGSVIIIESTRRMTMNEFAAEVARYSKNAVNLDMGRWAYGWIGKKTHTPWAVCLTHSIYVRLTQCCLNKNGYTAPKGCHSL